MATTLASISRHRTERALWEVGSTLTRFRGWRVGGGQAVTNVPSNLENPASGMDVVEAIFVGRDGAAGAMAATPLTDHASGDMTASVSGGDQGLPGSVGFVIVIGLSLIHI